MMPNHYRFYLQRDDDETGVSGTGRVADGTLWPDGSTSLRWRGEHRSFVNWEKFVSVLAIHGHDGKTRVMWLDQPEQGEPA